MTAAEALARAQAVMELPEWSTPGALFEASRLSNAPLEEVCNRFAAGGCICREIAVGVLLDGQDVEAVTKAGG